MTKSNTRRFDVTLRCEIEVSQKLLDAVLTDEWRNHFYWLTTPEQVAAWLAFNYAKGAEVTSIDGVADQPKNSVKFKFTGDDDAEEITR